MEEQSLENNSDSAKIAAELPTEIPADFDLIVVNMDKLLFEGKVTSFFAPVKGGSLAVLPGHTPLFTKLEKGKVVVNTVGGSPTEFEIENGIAKITQTKAVVLVGF